MTRRRLAFASTIALVLLLITPVLALARAGGGQSFGGGGGFTGGGGSGFGGGYSGGGGGFGGDPIKGWLHLPRARTDAPLPCVVEYLGYGGGRGLVHDRVTWATAGYAHFVMDSRGQGSLLDRQPQVHSGVIGKYPRHLGSRVA